MILRDLYTTKIDRMKTTAYKNYMFRTFGVLIADDISGMEIKGFIIKDIWYKIYLPVIEDGMIKSFRHCDMEYIGEYPSITDTKKRIKELIKAFPDRFIQFNTIMKGGD